MVSSVYVTDLDMNGSIHGLDWIEWDDCDPVL